jgi:hypothetical protein
MKKQVPKNRFSMRINQFIMVMLISVTFLYSCKRSDNNNKLIPAKDLVEVLSELYIADGLLAFPPVRVRFSAKDSTSNYIDIIKRHGYTKERMDNTMQYYFEKKPKKLENIYDQVLTRLSEKQVLLEKEDPPVPQVALNLWNGPGFVEVPETGIKDPVWFSIPIKDTGNYVLEFTTIVYSDDQSINPKVTVFFWHTDSSKTEFRVTWPVVDLPKDGQQHHYFLSKTNIDTAITHISGWFLDSDPKEGRWEKHARIENIILRKGSVQ